MGEGVKVSIVVPVYNVENYLRECMDSILRQTLQEIEVICVDDGSTDRSPDILKSYAEKDSRVKVISKENSGYGQTMNVGMDAAAGEYIGIVESDDYVASDMFSRLYETARAYGAQAVKSDHYIFKTREGREKKELRKICPEQYYNRILNVGVCPEIFSFAMMNWTGIYSRAFLEKNRIRHNETPGASFQDNGFWFQVISLVEKIVFLEEAFYYYRQDNPNSSINNKGKVFCICAEVRYIKDFLDSNPALGEEYHKSYFEKKFFNYFHSYHRIAEEYRLPFLERAAEEFREDLKDKKLRIETIDSWVYAQVNRVIDSPGMFYIEDSRKECREEYDRIHDKLMLIRNSEEFRKGLKLKRLLHMK